MAAVISRVITISLIAPVTTAETTSRVTTIVLTALATMAETTSRVITTSLIAPVITVIIAPAMTGISVARTAVTDTSLRRAPVILTGLR